MRLNRKFKKRSISMKYKITFAILLFSSLRAFTQVTQEDLEKQIRPLMQKVNSLQSENRMLKSEIGTLNSKLSTANKSIDSLRSRTKENSSAISQTANELGIKIKETGDKTEGKITEVSDSLSKNSLYGIIGVLSAILLSGILYWLLNKRQKTDKTDFIDQLSKTKSSIEESLVKEFGKQTELMDSQLDLIKQQKTSLQTTLNAEPDHSLALKVASEINLIERNINLMDTKTKGLKQLQASVGKLKDNLSANGYEMPELLGKQFHQGMKVIVTSTIPDENLDKDSEVITKVLIPQVNYNDKMIQTAQIETSKGY
jgi:DNA anti-recombination protein RmuC